jgi:membrane-associated protein
MRILATIAFLFLSLSVFSADTLSLILQNQYHSRLSSASVIINGTNYTTDKDGKVIINIPAGDSLFIIAPLCREKAMSLKKVSANRRVELEKEFEWKDVFNPELYIIHGGLWLILFIVFAETGLFVGFFLPGDALLFVTGILSDKIVSGALFITNSHWADLFILWALISVAGIMGNFVGYWFGFKSGHFLYHRKDSWLFKKRYLLQAHDFYEKNGGKAIIIARFLPIVRTFAPIVAGVVEMDKKKFSYYNIIGSVIWVGTMLIGGQFLQRWIWHQFHFNLKEHLEVIVIGIVAITTLPVMWKLFFDKKKSKTSAS